MQIATSGNVTLSRAGWDSSHEPERIKSLTNSQRVMATIIIVGVG
jgi:hypothetical protein